ncbi:MAG: iron-sulfur cluster assembly accessory protein [Blastochloris sp.]|nr:iron-sulfur cluster assembly accessory protein [Blastochloris sp.]
MIDITEAAALHIKELVSQDGRSDLGLRLYIDRGGCSGLQYNMSLDPAMEGDQVFQAHGVSVFVEKEGYDYLKGSTIDFEDSLTSTGFRIRNPNAKQTCGCGTSFEA